MAEYLDDELERGCLRCRTVPDRIDVPSISAIDAVGYCVGCCETELHEIYEQVVYELVDPKVGAVAFLAALDDAARAGGKRDTSAPLRTVRALARVAEALRVGADE